MRIACLEDLRSDFNFAAQQLIAEANTLVDQADNVERLINQFWQWG